MPSDTADMAQRSIIVRQVEIMPGDSLTFFFSAAAIANGHSINFFDRDSIALHLIIREATKQLVANSRDGEIWGSECLLDAPAGGVARGIAVTISFSENGLSLSMDGAPALHIEGRFIVLGAMQVRFAPSISLRVGPQTGLDVATAVPEARTEQIVPSTAEPLVDYGYVDYFAVSPNLGGIVLGGWIKQQYRLDNVIEVTALFDDQELAGQALVLLHERSDIAGMGLGYVLFLPSKMLGVDASGPLHALRARQGENTFSIVPSPGLEATSEGNALRIAREAMRQALKGQATTLSSLLKRPLYTGEDTLGPLGLPVHIEIDELVEVRQGAAFLVGWKLDPQDLIASVHLRHGAAVSPPLAGTEIKVPRTDIIEAFSTRYGLNDNRPGFVAFGDTGGVGQGPRFLEIRLADGRVAFKPLPRPARAGLAAIKRILSEASVESNDMRRVFETVLGPPIVAMNRRRLARPLDVDEVAFGIPAADPRVSIIIPLYGRLDFLRYQLAMFSRGGSERDEIIYVLDEPAKKAVLLEMAHSAFNSFGVPFRVILPSENGGFGPASNLGMRRAHGRYVCFLNSDVFPERSDFFDLLVGRLETEPKIGAIGGLLLFADGSVQHLGMEFQRLAQLGGWLFPTHPGKGRVLPPDTPDLIYAAAITGACMLMSRHLALELGGFDPDYVIGDFEDADLCRRIAEKGLRCAVDSRARAYHLERQSQGNSADRWRRNVTLLNAWMFNERGADGRGVDLAAHPQATKS